MSGKRVMLGLRVTEEMKQQLDEAAVKSGRSQSQEAELILKQGLNERTLVEALTGEEARPFLDYFAALRRLRIGIVPEYAAAVNEGVSLIIEAVSSGGLSEDRVKRFWVEDIVRHKDQLACDALSAAFNVLANARLAPMPDPMKMSRWIRESSNAR
jgi:hypothetical protein